MSNGAVKERINCSVPWQPWNPGIILFKQNSIELATESLNNWTANFTFIFYYNIQYMHPLGCFRDVDSLFLVSYEVSQ